MFLDNATAVAHINKDGGTKSMAHTFIASKMVDWCEDRSIKLSTTYLPGILNSVSDEDSRSS